MEKLYIVIPAYNEETNIETVAREWHEVVAKTNPESRLVVVDDGSKDSTYEKLQELAKQLPQLTALSKPNGGHGATVYYAYKYALEHGADYVFQTDSDGQTLASEFGAFWENRTQYDFLIGYRAKRQDGLSRIFVTKVLKLVLFLCFHVWVDDANTPYRLMSAESLKQCLAPIPDSFYLTNAVLAVVYQKGDYRIKSIPITFRPRQGGENSINFTKIFHIGRQAVADFAIINRRLGKGQQRQ
jgi:glycosyltransferase involved in cell wall biosynthesis